MVLQVIALNEMSFFELHSNVSVTFCLFVSLDSWHNNLSHSETQKASVFSEIKDALER